MSLMSREDALSVAGLGDRSTPVVLSGSPVAVLPAAYPVPPQMTIAVPRGALFAEFSFVYTGATSSTAGVGSFKIYVSNDGTTWAQQFAPYGYGVVAGPTAVAGTSSFYVSDKVPVKGRAYVGISAAEDGDPTYRGALAATVTWLS